MHCYFLASASSATPIVYDVSHLRDGKSYVTRSVRAIQNGKNIFVMTCSFQKNEPLQPRHQWTMPSVPPPEQCDDEEAAISRLLDRTADGRALSPNILEMLKERIAERAKSPIAIKLAHGYKESEGGVVRYAYWMKARSIPKYEAPFQKCILAYMSDMHL